MGILDSIFGKKADAGGAANQYISQIPGMGQAYLNPYINIGNNAQNNARWQYEAMTNDPKAFLDNIMKGYKTSEGYGFAKENLLKELSNAANAGGIAGTPADMLKRGEAVEGLLSKDQQQYLANVLGIQGTGLEGEQGIANKGFGATEDLLSLLQGSMNQQGGLAFNSAQQKNNDRSGFISMLAKALGAGGGALFGGPGGALAGAKLGGNIFGSI